MLEPVWWPVSACLMGAGQLLVRGSAGLWEVPCIVIVGDVGYHFGGCAEQWWGAGPPHGQGQWKCYQW